MRLVLTNVLACSARQIHAGLHAQQQAQQPLPAPAAAAAPAPLANMSPAPSGELPAAPAPTQRTSSLLETLLGRKLAEAPAQPGAGPGPGGAGGVGDAPSGARPFTLDPPLQLPHGAPGGLGAGGLGGIGGWVPQLVCGA